MKVIVSIQAKQTSSRGLVHYIAHSKLDQVREGAGREIFGEDSRAISVEKANSLLNDDTRKKRPAADSLHHLVISLRPEDVQALGGSEEERSRSLKEIARHAMQRFAEEVGTERLNWAAGIHRNTENPHVHIAVGKTFFDRNLEKKHLSKIPRKLLPHHETNENGERVLIHGILIEAAQEKLEEIQRLKAESRSLEKHQAKAQFKLDRVAERHRQIEYNKSGSQSVPEPKVKSDIDTAREILARAILAKYHLEKTRENLDAIENHGDRRRFRVFDPVSGKNRFLALFDLERRAERSAAREVRKQNISNPLKAEELRKALVAEELKKSSDAAMRIKAILHQLVARENRSLRKREEEYQAVKAPAEIIRKSCRRENRKLPTPLLSPEEVDLLQNNALEKKDFRAAHYFERVRLELSGERETPSRSDSEIERLKAARILSEMKLLRREKELKVFEANRHVSPVELDGKRTTLSQIDESIQNLSADGQKLSGRVLKALSRIGLIEPSGELSELGETKKTILEILNQKHEQMLAEIGGEKTLLKTLDDFYKRETNPEKELLQPKFTADGLAEIETLAVSLRLPDLYRENWRQQKEFIENSANHSRAGSESKRKIIAGRALARQILSGIELARCTEDLDSFKKHRDFIKFEVRNPKTGEPKFVSLAEVRFDSHGSIFDQTLEYFLENREKRSTRRELERLTKEKYRELKEDLKNARAMSDFAAGEARGYRTRSIFGAVRFDYDPIFTPKELLEIELRINQTASKAEARNLQKIIDSTEYSKAKNLTGILSGIETNRDSTKNSGTLSPDVQKTPAPANNDLQQANELYPKNQEEKREIPGQSRGR